MVVSPFTWSNFFFEDKHKYVYILYHSSMMRWHMQLKSFLAHWGRVTHICVGKLTIIGSDNGLSPERRQAIIWTNAGILLIGPLGTNFSEILIENQTFSSKKIRLKMSSAKCCSFRLRPQCDKKARTYLFYIQYHGSRWPDNARSQAISNLDTDLNFNQKICSHKARTNNSVISVIH